MNILHLNTSDFGGAGKAAYRLHRNLLLCGLKSVIMAMTRNTGNGEFIEFGGRRSFAKIRSDIAKFLLNMRTDPKYYFQNNSQSPIKKASDVYDKVPSKPDIIVAHWISNFVTIVNLYQLSLSAGVPVVWYLLDMAPLTGGCHYAWDCTGYMNKCGRCPALRSKKENDMSRRNWKKKHDLIQKMPITIVPATSRLTAQAKKATVFEGKRIEQIMLGIDAEIFKPVPRHVARAKLRLPLEQKIIFAGATSLKMECKGMFYLSEALKSLKKQLGADNNILIITAGNTSGIGSLFSDNFRHKHLDSLTNDEMLAAAYQAADMFVCPSIEDSGPMMINESIMCGTPVVSFNMGVAPDLVHTGKTGYLAELKNSEDLARGIKYVLDLGPDAASDMSRQCGNLGLQLCHPEIQRKAFKRLFDSLLNEKHSCA